ncbi:MAG: sulfatase-like hydrolase/transferase [Bacteroidota bacterium]
MFKKRVVLFGVLIALLPILAWLLWPLESNQFPITFNQQAIDSKEEFLNQYIAVDTTYRPPNIIIFLADDLAQTDISLYGSERIQTKHIDAIGRNGVTFTDGYVTSPICSPSRAGLLTGRYQQRFGHEFQPHDIYLTNRFQYYGFKGFVDSYPWTPIYMDAVPEKGERKRQGLPPGEITLAELLKKRQYHTAFLGKWHLGAADFALPCNRGFDYNYGFYASHSLFGPEEAEWIVNRHVPEDWTDSYIWKTSRVGESAMYRNCERIEEPAYLTQRIAEEAISFMETHEEEPFFLYVPFNAPHTPLQAPKTYVEQFSHIEDETKKVYHAMIASLDDAVGSVMNKLEELHLMENTLVFFLSDNGGATYTMTTDNAPFKGGKVTNFEGGIRVPYMMQWKGKIAASQTINYPVTALDIFTTAAAAARLELPKDRVFDGINLLDIVADTVPELADRSLFWQMGNARAIRKGDWKLLVDDEFQDTLLYNLAVDYVEQQNQTRTQREKQQLLLQELNNWTAQLAPPLWPGMIYYQFEDEDGTIYRFAD